MEIVPIQSDTTKTVYVGSFNVNAHNPHGVGWKKHGQGGRFVKKPVTTDYDGFIIGFLTLVCILLSGALTWLVINMFKAQYP
jgi:hypothetical protein